jgi:ubiquinone/menaquinone biosynthesis C-methylase UbiE
MKMITQYPGWELNFFDKSKNFRKYQNELISKNIGDYVAEVGPGNGENLLLYKDKAKKIDLFEPSLILYNNLLKKIKSVNNITLYKESFLVRKNKYDTIMYLDVLEHIENDKEELINAYRSLKTNGKLIINVPAFEHLYSKFDKDVGHYRRYSKKSFLNLIKHISPKYYKMTYFDSVGYLLSLLSKIFSSDYKKNFEQKINFWNKLIPISRVIDKIIFHFFGKSLFIVIVKK